MKVKPFPVQVLRLGKWVGIESNEVLPNELVAIKFEKDEKLQEHNVIPCDMVVVHGNAIVNESILTGESVPQVKENVQQREGTEELDSRSMVFGGT